MHRNDLSDVPYAVSKPYANHGAGIPKKNEQNIAKSPSYVDIPDMEQAMLTIKVNLEL